MTTNTQEIVRAAVSVASDGNHVLSLQIGRTGEKAKYQGRAVEFDLTKLPADSLAFALEYGLKQYIADGTAGSEDQAGYNLGIQQRLDKLAAGDFTRSTGERSARADTPEGRAKKLAVGFIRAKLLAAGQKADAAKINEAASKMVAAQPVWLERARKALEAEAKLADEMDFDLEALTADLIID